MGLVLKSIEDPRDSLDKATRYQLWRFAQSMGFKEIVQEMPAILMRRALRARGIRRVPPEFQQQHHLGGNPHAHRNGGNAVVPQAENAITIDAGDDLMKQWRREQGAPVQSFDDEPQPVPRAAAQPPARPKRPKSHINVLRDKCKALGIHMGRHDRTPDLERKIAEHGKDTSQRSE